MLGIAMTFGGYSSFCGDFAKEAQDVTQRSRTTMVPRKRTPKEGPTRHGMMLGAQPTDKMKPVDPKALRTTASSEWSGFWSNSCGVRSMRRVMA